MSKSIRPSRRSKWMTRTLMAHRDQGNANSGSRISVPVVARTGRRQRRWEAKLARKAEARVKA
jgi:hypothetical protein